ncbi:MAG: hypothetical protein QM785_01535 [Pyrinomonadaceae bacterium]
MHEYKQFYRRKLPHLHSPGGTLFVTFRLANSIPKSVINRYKNEKQFIEHQIRTSLIVSSETNEVTDSRSSKLKEFHRNWFRKFEEVLHNETTGPAWLVEREVAAMIYESLIHRHGKEYDLKAFSIMSNHVHAVFKPYLSERSLIETREGHRTRFESSEPTLAVIMRSLKGYTARTANKILNRSGSFWEAESYDHEVRNNEEFFRIVKYVLQNPVKAGLVDSWQRWEWNWVADDLRHYF